MNATDDLLIGKPTVSQNISELDAPFDSSSDHVNHEIRLFHGVFFDTFLQRFFFLTLFCEALFEFSDGHTKVSVPAFLAKNGKIKNQLGFTVCDGKKQSFEPKDATVLHMGMHSSDVLSTPPSFGIVRIIYSQTSVFRLVSGAYSDFRPQLKIKVIKKLSPVNTGIVHKAIEYIFLAVHQAA
jgi:hypothetical protein